MKEKTTFQMLGKPDYEPTISELLHTLQINANHKHSYEAQAARCIARLIGCNGCGTGSVCCGFCAEKSEPTLADAFPKGYWK